MTGEWNSKTTEDYIEMCKSKILASKEIQHDLAYMAGEWRNAVVGEIGRERYDALSAELGCDLAYAYVDYRVEQLMIDKLVKDRMPKSSADYIIRKAAESSLLGLSQTLSRSPLAEEIERRGEAAYRPSRLEEGTAKVLGASADTLMMGGVGSWTTFARFVGADVAISAVADHFASKEPEDLSVEQCISKGVFGSDGNVFNGFRKERRDVLQREHTRGRSQRAVAEEDSGNEFQLYGLVENGKDRDADVVREQQGERRGTEPGGTVQGCAACRRSRTGGSLLAVHGKA